MKIRITAWYLPASLALCALLAGCSPPEEIVAEQLRPVRFVVAQPGVGARERIFSGTSRYRLESKLSFKVGGSVEALPVKVGDAVEAGALLARLDASTYRLQAQQAEATLAQTRAGERNAAANYERIKGLYENGSASRNDLDAARAADESSRAQVRAAENALQLARLNVSYATLRADADCFVAAVEIELNENVSAGAPVMTVSCGRAIEIELDVPESLIGDLRRGMAAEVRFASIAGELFSGTLSELGIASSANAATFPVTVAIDEDNVRLRSGLAAEVTFRMRPSGSDRAIYLPLAAVIEDPKGTFVFVVAPTSGGEAVVERRPVTLGELTEHGVQVHAGLELGDRVVTAGVSVIREGQSVLIN